eukprot:832015-Pelagomonas_calceolata.AAC.4
MQEALGALPLGVMCQSKNSNFIIFLASPLLGLLLQAKLRSALASFNGSKLAADPQAEGVPPKEWQPAGHVECHFSHHTGLAQLAQQSSLHTDPKALTLFNHLCSFPLQALCNTHRELLEMALADLHAGPGLLASWLQ